MHLQRAVDRGTASCAASASGRRRNVVKYDPSQPSTTAHDGDRLRPADDRSLLEDTTLTINAFFGGLQNSCETLPQDGTWYPMTSRDACPRSQVTSLHFHFPWLVMANLRCRSSARHERPMR